MIADIKAVGRESRLQYWAFGSLIASLFALPLSSTLKSLFVTLALCFIIFDKTNRCDLKAIFDAPWVRASLALYAFIAASAFWSPAFINERMLVLEKYSKLLMLPILVVGFCHPSARYWGLRAFLCAMALTALLSTAFFFVQHFIPSLDPEHVFRNHIITGHMMALAAFISGYLAYRRSGKKRVAYIGLFCLFSCQIVLINAGRTGYIMYLFYMLLLVLQMASWKKSLFAFAVIALMSCGLYYGNTTLQKGLNNAVIEWQQFHAQKDKDTSIGYRLQFHQYARNLFKRSPIIGNGAGSFTHLYAEEKPVISWTWRLLEPHSQYWLIAAEFGFLGLVLFFIVIAYLINAVLQLDFMKPIALALMAGFLIGNLTDSLLFYSGSGYFFILMLALCLGEKRSK